MTCGSERGQFLVLFVVIFSVILAMGALAVDQGLAYGKHGLAQNNADAASRAGAYRCVQSLSENATAANACDSEAEDAAEQNAVANQVDPGDVKADGTNECLGAGNNDFPSMTTEVDKTSPSLFGKLFDIGDFTAKAITTTCVGAVQAVRNGDLEMIPSWLTLPSTSGGSHDPNKQYCGDPTDDGLRLSGEPCVIWLTNSNDLDSAGLFTRGGGNTTCGATNDPGVLDAIKNGLPGYTCSVGQQLHDEGVSDTSVLNAFETRLGRADGCSKSSNSRTAFGDTMEAIGTEAHDGPDFVFQNDNGGGPGDDDQDSTVYKQQGCQSPRLVLVPLVNPTASSNKQVVGFTALYILGCYRDDDGRDATTTMNDCHNNNRGRNDGGPCLHHNFFGQCTDNSDTEVRAGVVRMYLAGDSIQAIGQFGTGSNQWIADIAGMAIQTKQ
jgi:hypothetical protein